MGLPAIYSRLHAHVHLSLVHRQQYILAYRSHSVKISPEKSLPESGAEQVFNRRRNSRYDGKITFTDLRGYLHIKREKDDAVVCSHVI